MHHEPDIIVCPISDPIAGELLVCEVGSTAVMRCDTTELVRVLKTFGERCDYLASHAGKLVVGINGFNDLPAELYEIDEARAYIAAVTNQVPWWLALLHPSIVLTWVCSIIPKTEVKRGSNGEVFLRPDWQAIVPTLDKAIRAAIDHVRIASGSDEVIETVQINLGMMRVQILEGMNQSALDPYLTKQLRAARAAYGI